MSDDPISQALGLPAPEPEEKKDLAVKIASSDGNNDYEFARSNLYELIKNGMFALEDLCTIAKAGESARAYEVVSTMISTLASANKDLLELAKKRQEVEGKGAHQGEGPVAGQPGLVLTTADLAAMMKERFGIDSRRIQIAAPQVIEGEATEVKKNDSTPG